MSCAHFEIVSALERRVNCDMANVALDGVRRGPLSGTDRAYAHGSKVHPERGGQGGRAGDFIRTQRRSVTHGEFTTVPIRLKGKQASERGKVLWYAYIIDPYLDPPEQPLKPQQLMWTPGDRAEFPLRQRAATPGQSFVPSENLVALYKRGIMAAIELAKDSADFTEAPLEELGRHELKSSEELASLLQEQLLQFFALSASRGRARNLKEIRVTEGGSFTLPFEHTISSSFLVRPADLGGFLTLLAGELRVHIEREGAFGGAWGKMALHDGDLLLSLQGDRAPAYPPKEKARVIRERL